MARSATWSAVLTWLVVGLAWLHPQWADAAEGPRYAGIERPRIATPGARLVVEDVDLQCVSVEPGYIAAQMRCEGTVRWVLELPPDAADTELVFFAEAASIDWIEVDGADAGYEVCEAGLYDRWWPKPWLSSEGSPLLRSRVAVPLPFLVHSLAVESDLRRVELVASTDIGTQNIYAVFPSLAAGVGVPLRVHPTVRPGVRAEVALGWPFVSLLGTFDVFPALGSGSLELHGGVMLQLNL